MGGWRQDELELALQLGVSPRRLSGREPVEATRYEYEEVHAFVSVARWRWLRLVLEWAWQLAHPARLVGTVTEREPEFSREDVEAFVALMESKRVGPHGHPMSEAVSPLGDPSNRDREWDWHVPLPLKDFAQEVLDREKKRYKDAYPDADLGSLMWRVEKRDLPARSGS